MAKKKSNDFEANLGALSACDKTFDLVMKDNKEKFGRRGVYTGDEGDILMVCLPVPSLSTRLLLKQEGLPLGKAIMVGGIHESFKSSFCDEVIRWHRMRVQVGDKIIKVGKGYKFETEHKQWAELTNSIIGYDDKAIETHPCRSMDGPEHGWMTHLTKTIQFVKEKFEPVVLQGERRGQPRQGSLGRIAPACFVVDSVMGALVESTGEKIETNGAPGMIYPQEANQICNYMKQMPGWLSEWPFTVMGVNHKKVHMGNDGKTKTSMPGGSSIKFHQSLEFDLYRVGKQFHRTQDEEQGVVVRFEVFKNSTAPRPDFPIDVEVIWWYDKDNLNEMDQPRQVTVFDWHSATIEILSGGFPSDKITNKVNDIIDLHINKNQRKVWSSALGIPEKRPVRWREAGAMLEERPDLLYALYDVLGIRRRVLFQPGIDFMRQFEAMEAQMERDRALVVNTGQAEAAPVEVALATEEEL